MEGNGNELGGVKQKYAYNRQTTIDETGFAYNSLSLI
jgi:hypothetical protein